MAKPQKVPTCFRMTEEAVEKIRVMSETLGVPQVGVMELAIREFWQRFDGWEDHDYTRGQRRERTSRVA